MSYYDTTRLAKEERQRFALLAKAQNVEVLKHFQQSHHPLTPSQVHDALFAGTNVPLTSVRRSITNLTAKGELEKLPKKQLSSYGRPEHFWGLASNG